MDLPGPTSRRGQLQHWQVACLAPGVVGGVGVRGRRV